MSVMKRVLVVDDSPSVRELLVHILGSDPEVQIVGCAKDGKEAILLAQEKKPDVITMDLHMPNMDGFEATRTIMETCPTPIVIVSGSEIRDEVEAGFRAIEAGALIVVQRPFGPGHEAHSETARTLIRTIKAMAEVKVVRRWAKPRYPYAIDSGQKLSKGQGWPKKLIAIGASTGGPAALREIFAELPKNYALPIVIVQHMASGFVKGFAEWLSAASDFPVIVAEQGTFLASGCAYLAPDGLQMSVTRDLHITLSHARAEHGMCPSVSYLFRSIHKDVCPHTVAILLTGMGKDGALELRMLKESGAVTIVQDRDSAAVYGMPGEAIKEGGAQMILSPNEIGKTLCAVAQDGAMHLPFA